MKTTTTTKPTEEIKLEIDSKNEYCDILFFVNIEETSKEDRVLSKYVILDTNNNVIENDVPIQKAQSLAKSELVKQNNYIVKPIYEYKKTPIYRYDYYRIKNVKYREGLLDTITQHKNEWVAKAKLDELNGESSTSNSDNIDIKDIVNKIDNLYDLVQDILLNLIPLDPSL